MLICIVKSFVEGMKKKCIRESCQEISGYADTGPVMTKQGNGVKCWMGWELDSFPSVSSVYPGVLGTPHHGRVGSRDSYQNRLLLQIKSLGYFKKMIFFLTFEVFNSFGGDGGLRR